MMGFYRKKPIVIEAIKFDGKLSSLASLLAGTEIEYIEQDFLSGDITIPTLEGKMTAHEGDYIIKGIRGELYPCKPDIFEATYEEVE